MTDALTYTPQADPQAQAATYPGTFIVFEGPDGSGKTTQIQLLADALKALGHRVTVTREPGGTIIGEKLRALVLDHGNGDIDPHTEALIFAASRAAHAHQKIRPALMRGEIVLCDRYIDSSAAYQGAGRGLGINSIINLSRWATTDLLPDTTILLDLPLAESQARTASRGTTDRMEDSDDTFRQALHNTFTHLADTHPQNYQRINANRDIARIHQDILAATLKVIQ